MQINRLKLQEIVRNSIIQSRDIIYRKITQNVSENSFYSDIQEQLRLELNKHGLSMYSIDSNYNRVPMFKGKYGKGVGVYDDKNKLINIIKRNEFDIVVHLNGTGHGELPENLIHIEIKKFNNQKNNDRKKDMDRLKSTTKFANELSAKKLGLLINPVIFDSFYQAYSTDPFFKIQSQEIQNELANIKESNERIYKTLDIVTNEQNEWFANIIAGYQLGVFIDISPKEVKLTYYILGNEAFGEIDRIALD